MNLGWGPQTLGGSLQGERYDAPASPMPADQDNPGPYSVAHAGSLVSVSEPPSASDAVSVALKVYEGLEPASLWRHFAALNSIPRPPGEELAAGRYVQEVADAHGARWRCDELGNVVVQVAARGVPAGATPIAVQAHLDMVCEKEPSVSHDPHHDPIRPRREGDRIYARGTTLGADNGIGVAAALALLDERDIHHGPLELIFTVQEEIGLVGAMGMDASALRARQLINLDSEDPASLTIGSAGGADLEMSVPLDRVDAPRDWRACTITVRGLRGGHSGVDIDKSLANAIKLVVAVIQAARAEGVDCRLVALRGGGNPSAIPREAVAEIAVPRMSAPRFAEAVARVHRKLDSEWGASEPELVLELLEDPSPPGRVLSAACTEALLTTLCELPNGVLAMSEHLPHTIETSANIASVATHERELGVVLGIRSLRTAALEELHAAVGKLVRGLGAAVAMTNAYPGWKPVADSQLVRVASAVYAEVYGRQPSLEVVHGGLECGVLVAQAPGIEAVSFGPLIEGAHTYDEHVYPATVLSMWELLVALLGRLSEPAGRSS
jgi:dipeptidase D